MITSILLVVIALAWLLDGARLRARAAVLPVIDGANGDAVTAEDYVLLASPGVTSSTAGLRAVAAHARTAKLELVDLLPARARTWRCLWGLAAIDPARTAIAPAKSAGFAILASRALLERTGRAWVAPASPRDVVTAAARLGPFAGARVGWVIAQALVVDAREDTTAARLGLLVSQTGDLTGLTVVLQAVAYAFVLGSVITRPVLGAVCLAAMHGQPLIALAGRFVPTDVVRTLLFRSILEIALAVRLALAWRPGEEPAAITARRPFYAASRPALFEPRRADCPLCGGHDLAVWLDATDVIQHKPGEFTLERCHGCGHVFQNPRLSIAGLGYYYADAYDGLGEAQADVLFASPLVPYEARARSIDGLATAAVPARWLDVGCGHGHFGAVIHQVYPGVIVDGIELSATLDDAVRRGWIDRAHDGLFVDLRARLAAGAPYDVVSMSHYLEHTIDPRAELAAAHAVLRAGGLLMIEVPDPESRVGRWLGPLWFNWLQPQHLHFLSCANLQTELAAHGFETVRVHRGEAHFAGDFVSAAWLGLGRIAPSPRAPWLPVPGVSDFVWRNLVVLAGVPLLLGARLLDVALAPALRRPGGANVYRVVGRKRAG